MTGDAAAKRSVSNIRMRRRANGLREGRGRQSDGQAHELERQPQKRPASSRLATAGDVCQPGVGTKVLEGIVSGLEALITHPTKQLKAAREALAKHQPFTALTIMVSLSQGASCDRCFGSSSRAIMVPGRVEPTWLAACDFLTHHGFRRRAARVRGLECATTITLLRAVAGPRRPLSTPAGAAGAARIGSALPRHTQGIRRL